MASFGGDPYPSEEEFPDVRSAIRWVHDNTDNTIWETRTQVIRIDGHGYVWVLVHEPHDPPCVNCHRWERAVRRDG